MKLYGFWFIAPILRNPMPTAPLYWTVLRISGMCCESSMVLQRWSAKRSTTHQSGTKLRQFTENCRCYDGGISDAQLLIDFHRDSGVSKEDCTVSLPQGDAATLLLVVGSNMTMEHPNWEENQTAEALGTEISSVNSDIHAVFACKKDAIISI